MQYRTLLRMGARLRPLIGRMTDDLGFGGIASSVLEYF
jgi:hypothetical protein